MNRIAQRRTTLEDRRAVARYKTGAAMQQLGLPAGFIRQVIQLAESNEGVADLVELWSQLEGQERAEVEADLQEALDEEDDHAAEKPTIRFDDLAAIATKVRAFKQGLREKVDAWGGISKLALATGIPQPSLSRFFNSASMPRRTTLHKIANALGLSETAIVTDWLR